MLYIIHYDDCGDIQLLTIFTVMLSAPRVVILRLLFKVSMDNIPAE